MLLCTCVLPLIWGQVSASLDPSFSAWARAYQLEAVLVLNHAPFISSSSFESDSQTKNLEGPQIREIDIF